MNRNLFLSFEYVYKQLLIELWQLVIIKKEKAGLVFRKVAVRHTRKVSVRPRIKFGVHLLKEDTRMVVMVL